MKTLILSVQDIASIASEVGLDRLMDDVIDGIEHACREFDPARHIVPVRDGFDYTSPAPGLVEWMPVLDAGRQATMKMVAYHPENPATRALPTILSAILTLDTRTGHLEAVIDGTFATAVRTGAASAVASRVLALPDSRSIGLIGAGAQAVTQLHALSRLFRIEAVFVFDTDHDAMHSLEARLARAGLSGIDIHLTDPQTAARAADILCTATSVTVGEGPVFEDEGLVEHVHVNAVGADFPGKFELPAALLERALVCPDFTEQALKEGECQRLQSARLGPDLVQLVRGAESYRAHRSQCTVFDSTGWALQDQVVADILIGHARVLDIGTELQIESQPADPKDPYDLGGGTQVRRSNIRLA